MVADGNGKVTNGSGGPASNGHAYPIEDHTYDVVVVGAGGAGIRAAIEAWLERPVRRVEGRGDDRPRPRRPWLLHPGPDRASFLPAQPARLSAFACWL